MSSQSVNGSSVQLSGVRLVTASDVRDMSPKATFGSFEIIDSNELARRLSLPVSWVRSHTRARTNDELPSLVFGRYRRFRWGSPELTRWLEEHLRG